MCSFAGLWEGLFDLMKFGSDNKGGSLGGTVNDIKVD